jgi:UDP-2-acetamido-3-amino-2,3-dideoxy-glucuronate N-acetyltransferase
MGHLSIICDPHAKAREVATEIAPEARLESDFHRAISDPDIDGIMLATPAETHFSLGIKCLAADKHLFVEKPLALDVREARSLTATAEERRLILMVGHLLEYHPAVVRLRELVSNNYFGKLQYLYSSRLNFGKIRTEENALWSFAPHDIAVILRLVGDMPLDVTSVGGSYITPGLVDVTVSTLHFASGVRAHIHVSWLHPYKEQKLVLVGSDRMALFDDTRTDGKLTTFDQQVEWQDRTPIPGRGAIHTEPLPEGEPLRLECEHFVECIRNGTEPLTNGQSGVNVLRILTACQQSLQHNGRPIALTDIP